MYQTFAMVFWGLSSIFIAKLLAKNVTLICKPYEMTDLVPNILKTDLQVWCQTNLLEGYQEDPTEQCGGLESTIKSITVWLALHHSRETNPCNTRHKDNIYYYPTNVTLQLNTK